NEIWNNKAFGSEFANSLNEDTYVLNVILPAIRATLQDLPFVSKSDSSADQRGIDEVVEDHMLYDEIKLWREANDGMYYVRKRCKPDKDEFDIVGVQVAGQTMRSNVFIRDNADIHRYYHLLEAKVPIQPSDSVIVAKFVELLLVLRNILIVNMSLLYNAPLSRSARLLEKSSTVTSPR
ncbi:8328_t:CDS:2, partial [Acaulospora morrowiae]